MFLTWWQEFEWHQVRRNKKGGGRRRGCKGCRCGLKPGRALGGQLLWNCYFNAQWPLVKGLGSSIHEKHQLHRMGEASQAKQHWFGQGGGDCGGETHLPHLVFCTSAEQTLKGEIRYFSLDLVTTVWNSSTQGQPGLHSKTMLPSSKERYTSKCLRSCAPHTVFLEGEEEWGWRNPFMSQQNVLIPKWYFHQDLAVKVILLGCYCSTQVFFFFLITYLTSRALA